jgi:NAD(P)-dependent dehydrogenase (short-subunit alcohol dehydrogenase family)
MSFMFNFVWGQLITRLPYPETSFENQVIIVTGSNVGLGFEAARHFTRLNAAKVILAVRNVEKGNEAKKAIEDSTGRTGNVVEVWPLDLSSYDSVKAFATKASTLPRLDILLENAGIATNKYELFEDHESTITVNVISTYLLALLLLPKLRETGQNFNNTPRPPYLSIVSSEVHFLTSFPEKSAPPGSLLSTLDDKSSANMIDRYNVSKLLEVFFTRELASRSPSPSSSASGTSKGKGGVIINFLNPGLCHSELARNGGWGLWLMKALLARTTEAGSRTLVHASAAGEETHGKYLNSCQVAEVAPLVVKDEKEGGKLQKRVWGEIVEVLERIQPGILGNL